MISSFVDKASSLRGPERPANHDQRPLSVNLNATSLAEHLTIERIYTFWEPRDSLPPYLELCRETWQVNLNAYEVVVLDYSNLNDYLQPDALPLQSLRKLPLMLQKDAIMVAVLRTHGGIFMDMDTIALRDIRPLVDKTRKSELVMFNKHLAFLVARPKARILEIWLEGIRHKLNTLEEADTSTSNWDYLGNSELARSMKSMLSESKLLGLPDRLTGYCINSIESWAGTNATGSRKVITLLEKLNNLIYSRTERIVFATIYSRYLTMLDRSKYGFIAESTSGRGNGVPPEQAYKDYWFSSDITLGELLKTNPMVIGLHNSWTPEWYSKLSRDEVLSHDCLLSRTIRFAMRNSSPLRPN